MACPANHIHWPEPYALAPFRLTSESARTAQRLREGASAPKPGTDVLCARCLPSRYNQSGFLGFLCIFLKHCVRQIGEVLLVRYLSHAIVRDKRTDLRQRSAFQQRKDRPLNFLENFLPSTVRGNNVKTDVHVWLKRQQVGHSEYSGIDRCRVFNFEGSDN